MKPTRGDKRFWSSTRGRVILLLRSAGRTVNDLAAAVGLSDNAVRTHLDRLDAMVLSTPQALARALVNRTSRMA